MKKKGIRKKKKQQWKIEGFSNKKDYYNYLKHSNFGESSDYND